MKTIATFAVVVTASIALLQPAEGRSAGGGRSGGGHSGGGRSGGGHSFSSGSRFSSGGHYSHRSYSSNASRYSAPSTRSSSRAVSRNNAYTRPNASRHFSSQAAFRRRVASQPRLAVTRSTALNPRVDSRFNSRSATNRAPVLNPRGDGRFASRSAVNRATTRNAQTFANSNQIIARHSAGQHPNWDRRRDHVWNGHRCRWVNNSWVIFGLYPAFYPWGWGYGYPYGSYYYDDRYYDDGYAASEYSQSEYGADSSVSQVQAALAREGYYRGAIDGSFGPATRNAIRRYQSSRGLDVTGQIDRPVIEALGLG